MRKWYQRIGQKNTRKAIEKAMLRSRKKGCNEWPEKKQLVNDIVDFNGYTKESKNELKSRDMKYLKRLLKKLEAA